MQSYNPKDIFFRKYIADEELLDNIQEEWENWYANEAYKDLAKLSWAILEAKYIYYVLNGEHPKRIEDKEYDNLEKQYIELCDFLGLDNTIEVGINLNRPCIMLVEKKLKV